MIGYPWGMVSFWNNNLQSTYDYAIAQDVEMSLTKSWGLSGGINIPLYFDYFSEIKKWYWGFWCGYMYNWMSKWKWKISSGNTTLSESMQPSVQNIYIAPSYTYLYSDTNSCKTYCGIAVGLSYDIVKSKIEGGSSDFPGLPSDFFISGTDMQSGFFPIIFLFANKNGIGLQIKIEPGCGWNSLFYAGISIEQ
jgi:hypothetical protein